MRHHATIVLPAVPLPEFYGGQQVGVTWGQTLGDFYAAHALNGLLMQGGHPSDEEIVRHAWVIADLMAQQHDLRCACGVPHDFEI